MKSHRYELWNSAQQTPKAIVCQLHCCMPSLQHCEIWKTKICQILNNLIGRYEICLSPTRPLFTSLLAAAAAAAFLPSAQTSGLALQGPAPLCLCWVIPHHVPAYPWSSLVVLHHLPLLSKGLLPLLLLQIPPQGASFPRTCWPLWNVWLRLSTMQSHISPHLILASTPLPCLCWQEFCFMVVLRGRPIQEET